MEADKIGHYWHTRQLVLLPLFGHFGRGCVYLVNGHIGHEIVSKLVSDISDNGVVSGSGIGKDRGVIGARP